MIEIKIDQYKIKSDDNNYILYKQSDKEKTPKHFKNDPDKEAGYKTIGFFGKFEFLCDRLVEDKLRHSDAKTITELCSVINEFKIALCQLKDTKTK